MLGSFFQLELPLSDTFPYPESGNCVWLSSGRAALACLLENLPTRPRRVLMPRFCCSTAEKPLNAAGLPICHYDCTLQLQPLLPSDTTADDLLILVNYFGLTPQPVEAAAAQHPGPVIVDCTTALYSAPPAGCAAFYSPRKFSGLPDGGVALAPFPLEKLPAEQDTSAERALFLLQRMESGAHAALPASIRAEDELCAAPKRMSPLTRRLIRSIDYTAAAAQRLQNYHTLHQALAELNRLQLPQQPAAAPMCYPLVSGIPDLRDSLIDAGIALPLFWEELLTTCPAHSTAHQLTRTLLPLPLDQRYSIAEMRKIVSLIRG